jgi:predicted DNA-binding protein
MAISFRLGADTEARLRRVAKASGRSKSDIVREAVERSVEAHVAEVRFATSTLDRLKAFAGVVSTGAAPSTDTHGKFKAALEQKHRGRRSR